MAIPLPTFQFERQYWQQGIEHVAGLDEVGMGALAGPVVAAAVIFSTNLQNRPKKISIRDSKTLSAAQRIKSAVWIKENSRAWAVGEASVEEINQLNIRNAALLAMRRAIEQLSLLPHLLIIDGRSMEPHPSIPAHSIIKGDQQSFSIAAASILAKVYRDNLLTELDRTHPVYGFARHKGYGTAMHLSALKTHGPTTHHRLHYQPVALASQGAAA